MASPTDDWRIELLCPCGSREWVSDKTWELVHSGIDPQIPCTKCGESLLTVVKEVVKREYHYVQSPATYGVAECPQCKTAPEHYSEYDGRVWCEECQTDYIPKHFGVFSGPIALEACELLDICFDRCHIPTGNLERFVESNETGWWPETEADQCATPMNLLPLL